MKLVKDPVCGMEIEKSANAGEVEYNGTVYYFCCSGCKDKFEENPEQYIETDEPDKGHHGHHH